MPLDRTLPTLGLLLLLLIQSSIIAEETSQSDGDLAWRAANKMIQNINSEQLQALLKAKPKTELIDVRSPHEVDMIGGYIDADEHANIPRGWLEFDTALHVTNKHTPIVVYCGTNRRSPLAAKTLIELGYTNVKNYADGYNQWQEQGLPIKQIDEAPSSLLYSLPKKVTDGVYSAIGATAPGTYANSGHNNNLSFVVTNDGILLFNAGDNYLLAKALHHEIKKISDLPIRYVVLENAQGHAMLGANYWKQQGAKIIMHADAHTVLTESGEEVLERMQRGRRDKAQWTELIEPDQTFEDSLSLELGDIRFDIHHLGPGHSPGDIALWIPSKQTLITGDLAFHERLMPIFEHTDTAGWIETWEHIELFKAKYIIPGHGSPTQDITTLRKFTRDYLVYMRQQVSELLDDDAGEQAAYQIDQSAYSHLDTFHELALQNAGRLYRLMEFE